MEDGSYTAVIDSIEDDIARMFIEKDEGDEYCTYLEKTEVPSEGQHQDAIFEVEIKNGSVDDLVYKPDKTKDRKERMQQRFDRLSE